MHYVIEVIGYNVYNLSRQRERTVLAAYGAPNRIINHTTNGIMKPLAAVCAWRPRTFVTVDIMIMALAGEESNI